MPARKIPKFRTEAEEAAWWDNKRAELDKDFVDAAEKGDLRRLTKRKLAALTTGPSKVLSIRIPKEDVALAREQAAKKGLPYQTYIKSLLHEALRKGD